MNGKQEDERRYIIQSRRDKSQEVQMTRRSMGGREAKDSGERGQKRIDGSYSSLKVMRENKGRRKEAKRKHRGEKKENKRRKKKTM